MAGLRARSLLSIAASLAIVAATCSSALAAPRVYTINSALSQIDLTASADFIGGTGTLVEQHPTSITRYNGTMVIENFPGGDVNMQGGGAASALNLRVGVSTPNVTPGVGGNPPNSPANYGVKLSSNVSYEIGEVVIPDVGTFNFGTLTRIDVDLAIRGLAWDFSSASPIDRDPLTGQFDASQLTMSVAAGNADIRSALVFTYPSVLDKLAAQVAFSLLASQYPDFGITITSPGIFSTDLSIGIGNTTSLEGLSMLNSAAGLGTVTNVGPPYPVPSTLTLPIGATLPDVGIPGLLAIDMSFAGVLVATGIIPEPSTFVLAGMGLAGLVCYGARRRRS